MNIINCKIEQLQYSLETKNDELAFNEVKQQLDAFIDFQELTTEYFTVLLREFK